jgi:tetratricopeptide (TPR) repeat protein
MKKAVRILIYYSVFSIHSFCFSQNFKIDSLLTLLKNDKEDTGKANILNAFAWELKNNNPDTAILLSNQALSLAEKDHWKEGIEKSYDQLGVFYWLKSDYSRALDYYFQALDEWEKSEKQIPLSHKSKIFGHIGVVYRNQGKYPEALDYYFKALKIDEGIQNKEGIARHLGNIGLVYSDMDDYPKALDYYLKALKEDEGIGNKQGVTRHLGNIGSLYRNLGDYNKSLDYYFKALAMEEQAGNKNGIGRNLGNIGNVYFELARNGKSKSARDSLFNKSLDHYFKALNIYEKIGNKSSIVINLGNIGAAYLDWKSFMKAKEYLNRSLQLAIAIGFKDMCKDDYLNLSALDSAMGNFKSACENYKLFILYRDSLKNEENTKKQTRLEMQYAFDKKEAAQKAANEKQAAIAESEKQRQRMVLVVVAGVLLLVLVFAGFIFRALRLTRRQKDVIEKQKRMVEEKQKEILDSIHYARRIQTALLPNEKYIERTLNRLMH